MGKLARVPANDALSPRAARPRKRRRQRPRYYAFLSYSHRDDELADWLHEELEDFHVPTALAGKLTTNGVIPKRLSPIFRDEHELAAADDLGEEIEAALASSQFLIVLCSPEAARSRWTNAEIELFKRTRPDGCVLAAIASGEPFASEIPGREHEECFPPALRERYDRRGRPTGKRAEPLAADLREEGDGRRMGFLKLVAGMLGVGLDDLVHREATRRHRRMAWLAAASLGGMAVTSTLAFTAIQARDSARDQRREAESLVAFMLGDLKDKLEPIGRLDALDGVGGRVLAYYSKQDASDLSDDGLLQRSRALSLSAQVANLRGDQATALKLYSEAKAGTAEAMRRSPDDPQRIYDHAQNVFWIGEISRLRGQLPAAETAYREYQRLAGRMVELQPDNMRWRMEQQDAAANLGIALASERRFPEAVSQFQSALNMMNALAAADPANKDYQRALSETLGWNADARLALGHIDEAIALRERQNAFISRMLARAGDDVQFFQLRVPAEQALGRLYAYRGRRDEALQHLRASVTAAERLYAIEPKNTFWRDQEFRARLALGEYALAFGQREEAGAQIDAGCQVVRHLLATDPSIPSRRAGLADCQMLQARVALADGLPANALVYSAQAIAAARAIHSNDPPGDAYRLARAYRIDGDARRAKGDFSDAQQSWLNAFGELPKGMAERPGELDEHATILERLRRAEEAEAVIAKLNAMNYRRYEVGASRGG